MLNNKRRVAGLSGPLVVLALLAALLSGGTAQAHAAPGSGGPQLVPEGTGSATLEAMRRDLMRQTGRGAQDSSCWSGIVIVSNANNHFVSVERDDAGSRQNQLRARATAIGPWEVFNACRDWVDGRTVISTGRNSEYVLPRYDYSGSLKGMLKADPHGWDPFYSSGPPGSGLMIFRSYSTGLYVSAELAYTGGDYGMLRARASAVGSWEWFRW